MWKAGFILVFATICYAGPTTQRAIIFGVTPSNTLSCLGHPHLMKSFDHNKCKIKDVETLCDRLKCLFREWGWLSNEEVNLAVVKTYYQQLGVDHPEWATAASAVSASCLAGPLPAQGFFLNCTPYDIQHCVLTQFMKHATALQWSSSPSCNNAREFAARCPYCPDECFAPTVPIGSCNACLTLPRSPTPARKN